MTAEYAMLPRATQYAARSAKRSARRAERRKFSALSAEACEPSLILKMLGERQIFVDCDVIQADGGTRCASITGAYVALALACKKIVSQGIVKTSPLLSEVAAVSVGIIEGTPILDLCYAEDSNAEVDMNIVCTSAGKFIEIQGTAEREPFTGEQMNEMLALAENGINQLFTIQRAILNG